MVSTETACSPLVTAGEDGRLVAIRQQQLHYICRHRRLARTACRQITHADGGHIDGERRQGTPVIQQMANGYSQRIKPAERDEKYLFHLPITYCIVTSGMSASTRGLEANSRTLSSKRSSSVVLSNIFSISSKGSTTSG